jgi:crotonobetaine/carnitine-CoA ligase
VFLRAVDGGELSYGDVHESSLRWAEAYRQVGLAPGDAVAVLTRTRPEGIAAWLGAGWLGALEVPVHTEFRGNLLARTLRLSCARVLVLETSMADRLRELSQPLDGFNLIITIGDPAAVADLGVEVLGAEELLAGAAAATPPRAPEGRDAARVLLTSGTTGLPKGVVVRWAQLHATACGNVEACDLGDDDVYYSPFPLHHLTGQHAPYVMAVTGGSVVMRERFTSSAFWDDVRRHGCTTTTLVGSMAAFLRGMAAEPADIDNPLRTVLMAPLNGDVPAFERRFGVGVATVYNMTEISSPLIAPVSEVHDGRAAGRVRRGYECRIVDEDDEEVAVGEVGELVVRAHAPWMSMEGYWGDPDATLRAFRNHWMHTGDSFRRDEDGNFYFVDRLKDTIRRRGENISSTAVEAELMGLPEVMDAVVVGVPSEWGEEEVKAVVVLKPNTSMSPEEVIARVAKRLPRFMVPALVEFRPTLPRTATGKVRKAELR